MSNPSPPNPPVVVAVAAAEGGSSSQTDEGNNSATNNDAKGATSPSMPQPSSSSNDANISDTAAVSRPYVYRDFAQDDTDYGGDTMESVHAGTGDGVRGLTNQKLPAKLNAMLSDPGE